jgi:flagellar biosynthetic protein FlhB
LKVKEIFSWKLDLQLFSGEKTEAPTPRKIEQAREKGQVAKSTEFSKAFIFLGIFALFLAIPSFFLERTIAMVSMLFKNKLTMDLSIPNVIELFEGLLMESLVLLAPIFAITIIFGIASGYLQFGFLFTLEPLKMSLNKINPINGFKQIFSLKSVIEFLKSLLKITIVAIIAYLTFLSERETFLVMASVPVDGILKYTIHTAVVMGLKIAVALSILAILDFLYQKYEHLKQLRMSKQDIKDEMKNIYGDPLIKSKIKQKQMQVALQRMMQKVPTADVVITNPTHYSVAIKYDAKTMSAPLVVAKGVDYVAFKIREIAKQNDIVIMENKPLARALYDQVELDQQIPGELFKAVADVFAYVYKVKRRTM